MNTQFDEKTFISTLNPIQAEAVKSFDTPVLILAGAGSGKTRVLTYKIAYLIHKFNIKPENVLAVTFTNKAANEMKHRIVNLIGQRSQSDFERLWISTFHSTCVRMLKANAPLVGRTNDFVIYDDSDSVALIKNCLKSLNISDKAFPPKSIRNQIDKLKNNGIEPLTFAKQNLNFYEEKIAHVYAFYQEQLRLNNAFDFGDLLLQTVNLLKNNPNIKTYYQSKFQYLLVDEYQDTNRIQYEFIRLLTETHQNICVVGDEDQSIYKWRGADIKNILTFEADYKNTKIIKLEENYRSTKNIIEAASSIISNNKERYDKKLFTENVMGELILQYDCNDDISEANFVLNQIRKLLDEGYNLNETAIFYRTNAQSRLLEDVFLQTQMKYKIIGGMKFYDRKEIKDLLAFMKLAVNTDDSISLLRSLNAMSWGIGETTIQKCEVYSQNQKTSLFAAMKKADEIDSLNQGARKKIAEYINIIDQLISLVTLNTKLTDFTKNILESTGYLKMLKEEKTFESDARIENIEELLTATTEYDSIHSENSIRIFLEKIALRQDADDYDDQEPSLTLMTLHSSKGLEFPAVFIVGLEQGLFPSIRNTGDSNDEDIEEERRLFYVGMTRAKKRLFLSNAKYRRRHGEIQYQSPSQFLEEIDSRYIIREREKIKTSFASEERRTTLKTQQYDEFDQTLYSIEEEFQIKGEEEATPYKRGRKLIHPVFGMGVIHIVEGKGDQTKLTVLFDKYGIKKLMAKYCDVKWC